MRTSMTPWLLTLMITIAMLTVAGCEDPVPTDYEEKFVFTGYLIVDDPIDGITVTRSLPPLDSFDVAASTVDDAQITIRSESDTIELEYLPGLDGRGSYRAVDQTKRVEPETTYFMEARLPDGTTLSAATTTPERIEWIQAPRPLLQYPLDTINLPSPDSLKLIWTKAEGIDEYLISVHALDTIEYGAYLEPQTAEKNRRIERFFEANAPRYDDVIRWGFVQNSEVNVVWFAFKWFGKHEISVYAPDEAMLEWFKQVRFGGNQYQPLLSNIEGGLGVFGSAAVARQEGFVLKNQP